jgi:hypothetical protein
MKEDVNYLNAQKEVQKSRNKEMKELFQSGFGIHHAGMLRSDRNLTERYFEKGLLRVRLSSTRCCLVYGYSSLYMSQIAGFVLYCNSRLGC